MRALDCILAAAALVSTHLPLATALQAQTGAAPPTVREEVEVREIGVLADLPASWRGRPANDLAARLVVLEDGVARTPMSVVAVSGQGQAGYGQVVVVFDTFHCNEPLLRVAAAAIGSQAARLVALGPVEIRRAGMRSESLLAPTSSSEKLAQSAAAIARQEICPKVAEPHDGELPPGLAVGSCPRSPCLLVWAGAGWSGDPKALEALAPMIDATVRELASNGWVVLAAPVAESAASAGRPSIPVPESRPGSDRYTFGVNLLGRGKETPLSADEYESFVDLWLAPLRKLAAATAGEFATDGEALERALEALAGRSILWYRAERVAGAPAARLEVREPGPDGRRMRTAAWAPVVRP